MLAQVDWADCKSRMSDLTWPALRNAQLALGQTSAWVKLRRIQREHKLCGLPSIADIDVWYLRDSGKKPSRCVRITPMRAPLRSNMQS
jgi:hypothetical protein